MDRCPIDPEDLETLHDHLDGDLGARGSQEDGPLADVVEVGQCGGEHAALKLARVACIPHGLGLAEA